MQGEAEGGVRMTFAVVHCCMHYLHFSALSCGYSC